MSDSKLVGDLDSRGWRRQREREEGSGGEFRWWNVAARAPPRRRSVKVNLGPLVGFGA
jgi:hypothetical protein